MTVSAPYVATSAAREAVKGREPDVLKALGINWPRLDSAAKHIRCPYSDHSDEHPSWRWDDKRKVAFCTCIGSRAGERRAHNIFGVVCTVKRIDFEAAKIQIAEIIGRQDLIRDQNRKKKGGRGVDTHRRNTATPQRPSGCTVEAYAKRKELPVEFLKSVGLADISYLGKPVVKIPYFDAAGAEVAVRFRIAVDGKDKFRWRRGSKPLLYGLDRIGDARKAKAITIVEGESDCHTLWRAGFPAFGLPGAASWNEQRDAQVFDGIDTIYAVIEPDKGGEAVLRWIARSKIRNRVKLLRLADFKDPNSLYLDNPGGFAEWWRAAQDAAIWWQDEAEQEEKAARESALSSCRELASRRDILSEVVKAAQAYGLVGEERAVKLVYLAVSSRLLARIVSIAVKGPSSGGKSFLVEIVLKLFPAEAFYVLTAMSERSLAYDEEPVRHRMIVFYEAAGLVGNFATYLMRSLLSENRICYNTVEKTKGGLKARRIEREGPTGLITTTTAAHLHPENETRLVSVNVTDTPEQTKRIMKAHASRQGRADGPDLGPWHALQRAVALGRKHVEIPFAEMLADLIPPVAVRLRRDFPVILALIEAHALLHQASRERGGDGAIVATIEDYDAVREIVADLVSHGVDATVPATVRETVKAVAKIGGCDQEGVSLAKLKDSLGIDKSSTSRRVKTAIDRGYLKNLEDKRGRPMRLVLGDAMPNDVEVLPTLEKLVTKYCSVAPLRDGAPTPQSPTTETVTDELAEKVWTV
jgi:hypothetical protein